MPLACYFSHPSKHLDALRAYGASAKSFAWSIPHKMDLYCHARTAFGWSTDNSPTTPLSYTTSTTTNDDEAQVNAFQFIYDQLSSYWQVFRPMDVSSAGAPPRSATR